MLIKKIEKSWIGVERLNKKVIREDKGDKEETKKKSENKKNIEQVNILK